MLPPARLACTSRAAAISCPRRSVGLGLSVMRALLVSLLPVLMVSGCAHEKSPDARTEPATTTGTTADVPMANEKAAQSAAEAWLSLVDAGNSSQSWTDAATL